VTRLPRITGREVIAALKKAGFEVVRIKGSHQFLRHGDGRGTVVLVSGGEIIGPGVLTSILHDCELNRVDFTALL